MSKPNWDDAPKWAMWWAMDEDGDCFWYEKEPTCGEFSWYHAGEVGDFDDATNICVDVCWRKTLERRP